MTSTLSLILQRLVKLQPSIVLVYRPELTSSWSDRCFYKGDGYDEEKRYNHRSILEQEVVIEFDEKTLKENRKYADIVRRRLRKDGIECYTWYSGNKSVHVHFFIFIGDVSNLQLLKKTIMRHYSKNIPLPDLRLATRGHLIRAEFGKHEKTGRYKKALKWGYGFPKICDLPKIIWDDYADKYETVLKRKVTTDVKQLADHPGIKFILASEKFRACDDGRERALFMLIHILKPKYKDKKDELVRFLQDWYRYSGGTQLTPYAIKTKVDYHWLKTYTFGVTYLNELLESLGITEEMITK